LPHLVAAVSPVRDDCAQCNRDIDGRSDVDRLLHAKERKQHAHAKETCGAGPQRIGIVEQAERAADAAEAATHVSDEHRERSAHEQRWDDDEAQSHRAN
jgi:hypothetical protein